MKHQLILQLKISDIGHLHKFAASLHSEHPVKVIEVKSCGKILPMARIAISSVKLIQALNRLGVTEKKSFTVRPCEYVSDQFLSAYWRGLLDGDGTIYKSGSSKKAWTVSLVGNQAIVNGFHDFIKSFIASNAIVRPHKNIFTIRYSGITLPSTVAQLLYGGATIYLDRKYKLAQELCGEYL